MKSLPLALFGIPLSNLDIDEAVQNCIVLFQENKRQHPYSIAGINFEDIATIYGWPTNSIVDVERLMIARKINFPLASSPAMKWLCAQLGSSLKQHIPVKEFLIQLNKALGSLEKGAFVLGAYESDTKNAAIDLHEAARGLRLVGLASPALFVEGENLVQARERDALLIELINASRAELLIIGLESPKQELWFERVQQSLNIPLAIFAGNALNTAKSSSTSPGRTWLAKKAAWLYSFLNKLKIGWMVFALVFYHNINRLIFKCCYAKKALNSPQKRNQLFLSARHTIAVLPLPALINASTVPFLTQRIEETYGHDVLILDFREVRHIQPEGFYLLIETWQRRRQENKELYGYSPTRDIECLMKVHRVWDLYKNIMYYTVVPLIERIIQKDNRANFYDAIYQNESLIVLSLLGALSHTIDYEAYLKKLIPTIGQKNGAIDFSYCTFVDNTGFAFLLNLRKHFSQQKRQLTLFGLSREVKRQFRLAGVYSLFQIVSHLDINETFA